MSKLYINQTTSQSFKVQKGIQAVLIESRLWLFKGIRLECEKSKCTTYQSFNIFTICIKRQKCDLFKEGKDHNGQYTK